MSPSSKSRPEARHFEGVPQRRARRHSRWAGLALACTTGVALQAVPAAAEVEVIKRVDASGVARYVIREVPDAKPPVSSERTNPTQAARTPSDEPDGAAASASSSLSEDPTAPGQASATAPVDAAASESAEIQSAEIEPAVVPGSREDIRQQIERDREALRRLLSEPGGNALDNRNSKRIREISERLPRLQAELDALESEVAP